MLKEFSHFGKKIVLQSAWICAIGGSNRNLGNTQIYTVFRGVGLPWVQLDKADFDNLRCTYFAKSLSVENKVELMPPSLAFHQDSFVSEPVKM